MVINDKRLWAREMELGEIGRDSRGGISRFSWTPEYKDAMLLLIQWMKEAGMKTRIDAVGNIFGRLEGTEDLPAILLGSHLDTVPMGGKFDGLAGIMAALEVLQSFPEQNIHLRHPVELVAFQNEEASQFLGGQFGSKAVCGAYEASYTRDCVDRNTGISMRQAMLDLDMGLDPDNLRTCILNRADYFAFLELHIEQGRYLLDRDTPYAIVTDIAGIRQYYYEFFGESAHAGGMAMNGRKDAFAVAACTACEVERLANAASSETRGTVGYISVEPNEHNIIANHVKISVDFREVKDDIWENLYLNLKDFVIRECQKRGIEYKEIITICSKPSHCNSSIVSIMKKCAEKAKIPFTEMVSYPSHDAQQIHNMLGIPIGMIFVRSSNGGVSHCKDEYTTPEDLCSATRLFGNAIIDLDLLNQI